MNPPIKVAGIFVLAIAALALVAQPAMADCTSMCERCTKDQDCCQGTPDGSPTKCICRLLPQPLLQQEYETRGVNSPRCQCFGVDNLHKVCTAINYAKMMKAEAARLKALAATASTEQSKAGN